MFKPAADNKTAKKIEVPTMEVPRPLPDSAIKPNLTRDDMQKLKQILSHSNAEFYIVPTNKLREAIIKGIPEFITHVNDWIKKAFLEGNGIRISRDMLFKWLENTLDPMNSFILDFSEIRVEQSSLKLGGIIGA